MCHQVIHTFTCGHTRIEPPNPCLHAFEDSHDGLWDPLKCRYFKTSTKKEKSCCDELECLETSMAANDRHMEELEASAARGGLDFDGRQREDMDAWEAQREAVAAMVAIEDGVWEEMGGEELEMGEREREREREKGWKEVEAQLEVGVGMEVQRRESGREREREREDGDGENEMRRLLMREIWK